jgi:putative FmdB family regulatory protein
MVGAKRAPRTIDRRRFSCYRSWVPIYEYICAACKRRSSIFVRSASAAVRPRCEHCGSRKLGRALSRFAVHGGRLNVDDESGFIGLDERDPRTMARLMRQMGEESGEPMEPEFEEMIGRMEAGEDPESVMASSALDAAADDEDF